MTIVVDDPDRDFATVDDRAERALRAAFLGRADGDLDAALARDRVRARRSGTLMAVAVITVVVLVGVGFVVTRGGASSESVLAGPSTPSPSARATALTGWRTEYFRRMSFRVPAGWGYEIEPQADWCADSPDGQPAARYREPYVSLGAAFPIRAIGCPRMPTGLLTEHVAVFEQPPATDYAEGTRHVGGWAIVTRVTGGAVLQVTSRDQDLAERIGDSAKSVTAGPCAPESPVGGVLGARPSPRSELAGISSVGSVVLCQYEPGLNDGSSHVAHGLRTFRTLTGPDAQRLLDELASAPANTGSCQPGLVTRQPDISVTITVKAADGRHKIFVQAAGCPGGSGMAGGIDDGTTVRVLTRVACQAILVKPIQLFSASGDVGSNCLG